MLIGVVKLSPGLLVLSRWTKLGSYTLVMFWLLGIANKSADNWHVL